MKRCLLAFVICLFAALVPASPALGHAQLLQTTPGPNAVLSTSPANIQLEFSGNVSTSPGAIRVYDSTATLVDTAAITQPDNQQRVTLELPDLASGGYVVTWRVVSDDSHPISGAFSFSVGNEPVDTTSVAERLLSTNGGDTIVGAASTIVRAITFASLLVLVGAVGFLSLVTTTLLGRPRFKTATLASTGLLCVASALGFLLFGPYTAGVGLGSVAQSGLLAETARSTFGQASIARFIFAIALGAVLLVAIKRQRFGPRLAIPAIAVSLLTLLTVTLSGHAVTGRYVAAAIAADVVHLATAAIWIGGLFWLFAFCLRHGFDDIPRTVSRFSTVAFWSVVGLVITGTFQGWRQLGSTSELLALDYGRLLLIKLSLVAILLVVANQSRRWINRRLASGDPTEKPALLGSIRKRVGAEAGLSVVIVFVTALLVNAVPSQAVTSGPQVERLEVASYYVDAVVDPADAGPNAVHFYILSKQGSVADVAELAATLSLPSADIEDVVVPLYKVGTGHFANYGMAIPIAGQWILTISVPVSDVTQETVTTTVDIR